MSTFKNKHILITGGAGGIGFLMGREALKHDAKKLIIWDINEDNISESLASLSDYSERIFTYKVDISDPDQIYQSAEQVLAEHHHVDILINNAGTVVGGDFSDHSNGDIDKLIRINLLGTMHTTRTFLESMINRGQGHIVNIASAAGRMANPGMSVYAGSKWGVIGWSESLRLELESNANINVTTVEPSYINTGLFEGVSPPVLTPLLDAEEISKKIIYAIQKDKIHLREPFMVKILPFLKGILPTRIFDFVAGRLFQVYHSMDTFKGRT
ncbi:short-chain dehydrogenase [Aliifodinibius salipaludis]|uniref:Short-chain dehydrogenase n=1 Tax=Fodinibius salipaludis TaxID=2032627 RepID=A0A2A2GEK5_9BACT|nr:SDR family oxidoreductase [Aliifodinibius salipaludis]PAU95192.1 short-chain dehydrogenase [Aliifodinibius salipaludis]